MLRQHNSHETFDNAYLFYLTPSDTIKVTLLKILFLYVFVEDQKLSQTAIINFFYMPHGGVKKLFLIF